MPRPKSTEGHSSFHPRDCERKIPAGMVMVNLPTTGVDYHVPFGGRKASRRPSAPDTKL